MLNYIVIIGLVGAVILLLGSTIFSSLAFSEISLDRSGSIDVVSDSSGIIGLDVTDSVTTSVSRCSVDSNALVVNASRQDDVDTTRDVIVKETVNIDIDTDGSVKISSGAELFGDIDPGGCVVVGSDGYVDSDIDASSGGSITLRSNAEVNGNLDTSSSLVVASGGIVRGDVNSGGDVTMNGKTIDGDIDTGGSLTVGANSLLNGAISAGGEVVVESGGTVKGDVDATGDVTIKGDTVEGDIDTDGSVTIGSESTVEGGVEAGGDVDVMGTVEGDIETEGGVAVTSGGQVNGDVDAGTCIKVTSDSQIDGDASATSIEGAAYITGDAEAGDGDASCNIGGSSATGSSAGDQGDVEIPQQRLLTVTNNLEVNLQVTITLVDASDGNLVLTSTGDTASSVDFELSPGEKQQVDIKSSSDPGNDISIEIVGKAPEITGTLTRSIQVA